MEWCFDEPQADWKPTISPVPGVKPVQLEHTGDALRFALEKLPDENTFAGSIYVDLNNLSYLDWAYILVRARITGKVDRLGIWWYMKNYHLKGR